MGLYSILSTGSPGPLALPTEHTEQPCRPRGCLPYPEPAIPALCPLLHAEMREERRASAEPAYLVCTLVPLCVGAVGSSISLLLCAALAL